MTSDPKFHLMAHSHMGPAEEHRVWNSLDRYCVGTHILQQQQHFFVDILTMT